MTFPNSHHYFFVIILSGWKLKHLSFGGRLVLLKSVLSSLAVYALSFFKAPSGIVSSIESRRGRSFVGRGREASMWCRDISAMRREEWFANHVSRLVGNGENTFFWSDVWCGVVMRSLGSGSIDFMIYHCLRGR